MREISGDATRGGDWALVRLRVDDDRIVDADADGLDDAIAGLTLLEAASVRGEPLAVEALASALGQVFQAAPQAGRVRGSLARVDRPCMLLAFCGRERARDLSRAGAAARHARPA